MAHLFVIDPRWRDTVGQLFIIFFGTVSGWLILTGSAPVRFFTSETTNCRKLTDTLLGVFSAVVCTFDWVPIDESGSKWYPCVGFDVLHPTHPFLAASAHCNDLQFNFIAQKCPIWWFSCSLLDQFEWVGMHHTVSLQLGPDSPLESTLCESSSDCLFASS